MIKSELHFLGHRVDLLTVETTYDKAFDKYKGIPELYNRGGLLRLVFDLEENFRFLERMTSINYELYKLGYPVDDGKIVFYDANNNNLKTWKFKDASVIYYKGKFDVNASGINIEIIISPAIQDYGCKIHRSWHISPIKEHAYKSPIYAVEEDVKEKEPFRIDIDAKNSDIKNGVFGFDKIPNNYKSICDSDIEALRQEYKPIANILGEEYLPPWLSMRKGQTVELMLNWKKKRRAEEYSQITFDTHADFTITPTNLKDADSVQITCNTTNPKPTQLLIKADGTIVGALNIFYPKPKTIDLEWFFVEITGNKKDYKKLNDEIKISKLTILLKKGLNPALIDIKIKNKIASTVNLESQKEYFKINGIIKKADKFHYIENSKKELFVARLKKEHNINKSILSLFLVNRSCLNTGAMGEDGGAFNVIAGFSPTGTGVAYGILDQESDLLSTAIMHEVMHALGLHHTFSPIGTHTFSAKRTNNYMDYKDSKEFTWQWQWKKLHTYPFLK